MVKKIKFYKNQSMDNHLITINSFLSADFKNKTEKEFKECLDLVPEINKLIICKRKCGSKKEYENTLSMANICLSMAMIERRLGYVEHEDFEKKYVWIKK